MFIDTEVFVGKNFSYSSRELKALRELAEDGVVSVYITDVVHREVKQKIRDRVSEARHALDTVRTIKAQPNVTILRNVAKRSGFSGIFAFDEPALIADLEGQFEAYLKSAGIKVIPTEVASATGVLQKYFDGSAPFESREDKKSEFPDAFIVATIAAWCAVKNVSAYAISGDKGFRAACTAEKYVLPLSSILDLTDLIARASTQQAQFASSWFMLSMPDLRRQIASEFRELGFILTDQDGDVVDVAVDPEAITVGDPSFLTVDEGQAEIVVDVTIPYTASLHYDDPDATFWVEGDKYVVDWVDKEVEREVSLFAHVELEFSPVLAPPTVVGDEVSAVEAVGLNISDVNVEADLWDERYHK